MTPPPSSPLARKTLVQQLAPQLSSQLHHQLSTQLHHPAVPQLAAPRVPQLLSQKLEAVERQMARAVRGDRIDRLGAVAQDALRSGGRRVRARLCLIAADALGVEDDDAIRIAAAVELLHNASLVHDDVQDGDRVRRTEPALWVKHGVAQAINAGDLMLMLPFTVLSELRPPSPQLFADFAEAAVLTVRAQAEELSLLETNRTELATYLSVCEGKTGALMALPILAVARRLPSPPKELPELLNAFRSLGLLFQLVDDLVDLYGDKGRGEQGCDLKEGKISILVALHCQKEPASREELLSILRTPRELTSAAQLARARELFIQSQAPQATLGLIEELRSNLYNCDALARTPQLAAVAMELMALILAPLPQLDFQRSLES